ncbi:flagellar protein export ATPase FliI [soil metagenome]
MFDAAATTLEALQPLRVTGRVAAVKGLSVLVQDLPLPVGSLVRVERAAGGTVLMAEVVGFAGQQTVIMSLGQTGGIAVGDRAVGLHAARSALVGSALLGRVVNGLAEPIDGLGPIYGTRPVGIDPPPRAATERVRVTEPLMTGVSALDLMTTLGRGQRLGVFAGPGVGKSTLLGSIAKGTAADVVVLALIGERGREVQDFLHGVLGAEGLKRAVVVASTGDESPLMRIRAALTAAAIAEYFRDQGRHVLLMMDSVTRFAQAQRQVGLAAGEPPASKGYTPSVFAGMSRLLERAGQFASSVPGAPSGSVTGLYTVLVEGDDMTEPVADAARGILDGHVILSRTLAQRGHFPAIDVLDSISRCADDVCTSAHTEARRVLVRTLAAYRESEDIIQIGAYARGSSAATDAAIEFTPRINAILQQGRGERVGFERVREQAQRLAGEIQARLGSATPSARAAMGKK